MKHTPGALLGLFLLVLVATIQASTIEHPGILPKDANCSSCHANKTKGKSVHSAMAIPCTVCHLTETQGDMTTLNLVMPKEKICFACHEKSAPLPRHSRGAKAPCVECHDSHSSSRPALLREQVDVRRP
jgi:predicted CXXCH cytochrome family protein